MDLSPDTSPIKYALEEPPFKFKFTNRGADSSFDTLSCVLSLVYPHFHILSLRPHLQPHVRIARRRTDYSHSAPNTISETQTDSSLTEEQEHCSKPTPHSATAEMEDDGGIEKCAMKEERKLIRAEIDTSAPFESVKEAAIRFGGIGFWKPRRHQAECGHEDVDVFEVEKQKAQLTDHLVEKESETLDVLKELEHTKRLAGELKLRLYEELSQHEAALRTIATENACASYIERLDDLRMPDGYDSDVGAVPVSSALEGISMELNEAKMTYASVTKASIELLSRRLENEINALELTQLRLAANSSNISSLEGELNLARQKLELMRDYGFNGVSGNPTELTMKFQRLSSETEEFKILGEAAKSELFSAMLEIEQTTSRIKIAEMSLVAANRMNEVAKIAEETALSELKFLTNGECPTNEDFPKPEGVRLSKEQYEALITKARDAEEMSIKRVSTAMLEVDEANLSKMETLMKLERATEEVKITKMEMESALRRVETATVEKLAVEEALRQRRFDHPQKRRTLTNSTKFKTVGPSQYRKEPSPRDVNGMSLVLNDSVPVLCPTLSIGQILNNKLHHLDQAQAMSNLEKRVLQGNESLGQMLGRHKENSNFLTLGKVGKADDPPRKGSKFTFVRFSMRLATQSRKMKIATGPRSMMCSGQAAQ